MAKIKKGSFADQLTERMVPYMEEATKAVTEKFTEQIDNYFKSVKPFNLSVDDIRQQIQDNSNLLEGTVTKIPQGLDSKRFRLKDIVNNIEEISKDVNKFISDLTNWQSTLEGNLKGEFDKIDSKLDDIKQSAGEVLDNLKKPEDESEGSPEDEPEVDVEAEGRPVNIVDVEEVEEDIEEAFRRKDKVDLERSNALLDAVSKASPKDLTEKLGIFIILAMGVVKYWDNLKSWFVDKFEAVGNLIGQIPGVKKAANWLLGAPDEPIAKNLGLNQDSSEEEIINAVKDLPPDQLIKLAEDIEGSYRGGLQNVRGVDQDLYKHINLALSKEEDALSGKSNPYSQIDLDREYQRQEEINNQYIESSSEAGSRDYTSEVQQQMYRKFENEEVPLVREEFKKRTGIDLNEVRTISPENVEIYNNLLEEKKIDFETRFSSGGLPLDIPEEVGAWSPSNSTIPRVENTSQVSMSETHIYAPVFNIRGKETTGY